MDVITTLTSGTTFLTVPKDCQVLEMIVSPQAAPGAAGSVTLSHGANAVNVASVIGVTAGDPVVGTANATYGKSTFVKGTDSIKIVVASTNLVAMAVTLVLDPFCRG